MTNNSMKGIPPFVFLIGPWHSPRYRWYGFSQSNGIVTECCNDVTSYEPDNVC